MTPEGKKKYSVFGNGPKAYAKSEYECVDSDEAIRLFMEEFGDFTMIQAKEIQR